ncbi:MAG: murein biosynthesis integral membrane protein MurJ [Planctomycetota bacterium]|nr:murein biosynthesis integral membrane protein MurJ [Planctomycetota bacterium]
MTESKLPDPRIPFRARLAKPWRSLFVVYFILLTIGTHLPNTTVTEDTGALLPDKLIHLFAFMGLTLLLWRSRLLSLTWLVPAVVALWIPLDEWTQRLAGDGRTVALDDMIAGWMGVIAAGSLILVLSPLGPAPLRAGRRRLMCLVDLVVTNTWVGVQLIVIPTLVFTVLFIVPWFVSQELERWDWIYLEPELLFLPALGIAIGVGVVLLKSQIKRLEPHLLQDTPCFECGNSIPLDNPDQDGRLTCTACGSLSPGSQWESLTLPPSPLDISGRFILSVFIGLLVAFLVFATGMMMGELFLRINSVNMIPSWVVFGCLLGGAALIFAYGQLTSKAVIRLGWICQRCGYDLHGAPDEGCLRKCPECGRTCQDWRVAQQSLPSGFERNARTVMSMTALSRLTGLAREAVLSRLFGTDAILSSYFFAFLVPNLFRRLFGEGALAAAFLPSYERLTRENPEMASRLATATLASVAILLGIVVIIAEVILAVLVAWIYNHNTALWLLMIMLPYTPLVCRVAIFGAMLQVHGRFGPTAAAPIILNALVTFAAVAGVIMFGNTETHGRFLVVTGMGMAVVCAGLIQLAWSWMALQPHDRILFRVQGVRTHLSDMFRRAGPMILGLGVLQVNTLVDGLIASYRNYAGTSDFFGWTWPLDEGAMAVLTFAQRLYQFPLGVFGIAIATAIYPMLARLADDREAFADTIRRGLRLVFFIGFPASLGLMVVARPLTGAILQGGAFDTQDTGRVAFVLLGYASCVWAYSMIQVITRAFYAKGDTVTPVRIAISVVVLNLILNLVLIWTPLKEAGLAWSTAICATVQTAVLLRMLRRHVDLPLGSSTLPSMARTVVLSILMVIGLQGVMMILPDGQAWLQQVRNLAVLVAVGSIIVAGGAAVMRMPELRWAVGGRT